MNDDDQKILEEIEIIESDENLLDGLDDNEIQKEISDFSTDEKLVNVNEVL